MESSGIDARDAQTCRTWVSYDELAEYNAALKRRGSLEIWFDPEMHWLSKPCGRPGRPMRFSDSAIELCLTLKTLFNLPLRQVTGLVSSLIKMAGLDWPVPDYTTLCRRQKTLKVNLGGRITRREKRSMTTADRATPLASRHKSPIVPSRLDINISPTLCVRHRPWNGNDSFDVHIDTAGRPPAET